MRKRREASAKEMSTRLFAKRVFVTVRKQLVIITMLIINLVGMDC